MSRIFLATLALTPPLASTTLVEENWNYPAAGQQAILRELKH